ncbi:MAG: hypothetical protein LBC71_08640 [Oscillospiraceae bacterium]|jgi:predicted aspartyl protease|nr:hypothetical protein [Oscillospiraceae bacterium]
MNSVPLIRSGVANIFIAITALDGMSMPGRKFLVDTGATVTTIPKDFLINILGYTEEFIIDNKILLPDDEKPLMADGKKADLYKLKAPRINISGYEMQTNFILTSDTIKTLNFILGLDVLQFFNFSFNFDAIDEDAPHGRMFYEFRESRITLFTKLGEPFAYKLNDSSVKE